VWERGVREEWKEWERRVREEGVREEWKEREEGERGGVREEGVREEWVREEEWERREWERSEWERRDTCIKVGSTRVLENATWEAEWQTGTNKFEISIRLGKRMRIGISYAASPPGNSARNVSLFHYFISLFHFIISLFQYFISFFHFIISQFTWGRECGLESRMLLVHLEILQGMYHYSYHYFISHYFISHYFISHYFISHYFISLFHFIISFHYFISLLHFIISFQYFISIFHFNISLFHCIFYFFLFIVLLSHYSLFYYTLAHSLSLSLSFSFAFFRFLSLSFAFTSQTFENLTLIVSNQSSIRTLHASATIHVNVVHPRSNGDWIFLVLPSHYVVLCEDPISYYS
jgi:hypothetical protein